MLSKFNSLYKKILELLIEKVQIKVGYYLAVKKPFFIKKEDIVENGSIFINADTYAGKIIKILNDNEIILSVCGNYKLPRVELILGEKEVIGGFSHFRCFPIKIKYKLEFGLHYYINSSEENTLNLEYWKEVVFKPSILDNITNLQEGGGDCGSCVGGEAAIGGDVGVSSAEITPGITTNSTFGDKNNACLPIIPPHCKDIHSPGITTADMRAMYTLYMNPKNIKTYPLFKRITKKKKKKK